MSKISELSDGGVIQGGDTLIAVRSGGNVKVTYGGSTTANIDGGTIDGTTIGGTTPAAGNFTTGSFTGDVSFGDNDKAIFGAGSDLQIYHDGTKSLVRDVGTGDLVAQGNNLSLQDVFSENYLTAVSNGAVTLYHDGASKLATTSTGIQVTGDISNASGDLTLDVAGYINLDADGGDVALKDGGTEFGRIKKGGNNLEIQSRIYDGDIVLKGFDNTSIITALALDMSAAGAATFNAGASFGGTVTADGLTVDAGQKVIYNANGSQVNSRKYQLRNDDSAFGDFGIKASSSNSTEPTKNRFNINKDGDISFYENTGTTAKFFWDSSAESLGIGTSSPTLTGFGSGTNGLEIADATLAGIRLNGNAADSMYFVSGSNRHWLFGKGAVPMTFSTNGTERMRIDASGNLLFGTTSPTAGITATSGNSFVYRPAAELTVARQGSGTTSPVAIFNQTGDDGQILDLRKDGSTVGSIGTVFGDLTVGTGDVGLRFSDDDSIRPWNLDTNSVRDNGINLGAPAGAFKDLYLSGGAYLGGTAAANKLDDYEEGSWTPQLADNSSGGNVATQGAAVGRYTKVGRMVTVDCYLVNVNTTGLVAGQGVFIRDLPFTAQGATYAVGAVGSDDVTFSGNIIARVDNSGTYVRLLDNASGAAVNAVTVSDLTSGTADIILSVTYQTA